MEMLAFTKNRFLKTGIVFTVLTVIISSCTNDDLQALYSDVGNHKVFEVRANISPLQENIDAGDTIWIKIHAENTTLNDLVTGKSVAMHEASFLTQIELKNLLLPESVVDIKYLIKTGEWYTDLTNFTEASRNSYSFKFGHPDTTGLELGIIFNKIGSYALWFNNFPNPYQDCDGNNCDSGKGFWYDIFYNFDLATNSYQNEDFVEYLFNLNGTGYDIDKFDSTPFLDFCVYPESVFFINVR